MFVRIAKLWRNKRGQSLVEYGILVGAIAIVCLAATALLGHKVADLIAIGAAALPGDDADDQVGVFTGKLVKIDTSSGVATLGGTPGNLTSNLGISGSQTLVTDELPSGS